MNWTIEKLETQHERFQSLAVELEETQAKLKSSVAASVEETNQLLRLNQDLCRALTEACLSGGVEFLADTQVIGLETSDDRVVGVTTEKGGLSAGTVVLAAGAWSGAIAKGD